mmetsp:Transcript_43837/g.70155  ORF Transcript_43837/g.70155 Transcript_43837/m.70155 type:complete len:110 (-) Transcript_43837:1-330(-)
MATNNNYKVIYEVNLEIDNDAVDEFIAWLKPHMQEIIELPGFVGGNMFKVEPTEEDKASTKSKYIAVYYVETRKHLQEYFDTHAARLRGDGIKRFEGRFQATRRILEKQ